VRRVKPPRRKKMSTFEHRTKNSRDPEEVWGVVGDFDNDARWRRVDVMTSDPEGPPRVGTNTHGVLRFLGSTYVTETTVGPGRHLAYEGTTIRGYRRVEEAPGGAEFVEGLQVKLSGPMRLLEPLLTRLYAPRISTELQTLKQLLEHAR
jgi:hypothetical protein